MGSGGTILITPLQEPFESEILADPQKLPYILLLVELLKDTQGLQLGEVGEVEAVVDDGDFEQAVALEVGEAEEMHGGVVHAHHELQLVGLAGKEHVAMEWGRGAEDTLAQVEIVTRLIVVEVGIEPEEAAEAHEEHEVEVGEAIGLAVEPLDAAGDVVEEGLVALFGTQGVVEELGDEERDGELVGMEGDGGEGRGEAHVAELLELHLRTDVDLGLEEGEGLEELLLHTGLRRLGDVHHERQSSVRLGEHVHDHSRLAVLERMEDYGLGLRLHTGYKGTKIVESGKWKEELF